MANDKKVKPLTGVFAQQMQGSTDQRTGKWTPDTDRYGKPIYSESFTVTVENGSKSELPSVITAKRIAKLVSGESKVANLDKSRDYVLVRTREFDDREGRTPAIKAWYRPKAEPVTI